MKTQTCSDLIHPEIADTIAPELIPAALSQLAAVQTKLTARLMESYRPLLPGESGLVDIDTAARMLGLSRDFLYHHWKDFDFARKVSHRQLRFDVRGIEQYLRAGRNAA